MAASSALLPSQGVRGGRERLACWVGGEGLGLQGNRSWGRFTFHNKDRRRTTPFGPRGGGRGRGRGRVCEKAPGSGRTGQRGGQKEAPTPGAGTKAPPSFPEPPFLPVSPV